MLPPAQAQLLQSLHCMALTTGQSGCPKWILQSSVHMVLMTTGQQNRSWQYDVRKDPDLKYAEDCSAQPTEQTSRWFTAASLGAQTATAGREIPPGLLSQPPESGSLATASHNWSTYHSVCPACSLHSAPAQHTVSSCHTATRALKEGRSGAACS